MFFKFITLSVRIFSLFALHNLKATYRNNINVFFQADRPGVYADVSFARKNQNTKISIKNFFFSSKLIKILKWPRFTNLKFVYGKNLVVKHILIIVNFLSATNFPHQLKKVSKSHSNYSSFISNNLYPSSHRQKGHLLERNKV